MNHHLKEINMQYECHRNFVSALLQGNLCRTLVNKQLSCVTICFSLSDSTTLQYVILIGLPETPARLTAMIHVQFDTHAGPGWVSEGTEYVSG